jgi:GrpB-like predicted nucleotidyltransferase (UPF0157 family)
MTGQPVHIVDYDPQWPAVFDHLRDQLHAALGSLALRIEHVGSTAVPGLAAKPIIDLDVVIRGRGDLPAVTGRLRPLGYQPEGNLGVPGREAFTTPPGAPPHHLYVCPADSGALARHLAFRDFLRTHPATACAYAELKRSLARRFCTDRTAYTEAKTAFIDQVLTSARPVANPKIGELPRVRERFLQIMTADAGITGLTWAEPSQSSSQDRSDPRLPPTNSGGSADPGR